MKTKVNLFAAIILFCAVVLFSTTVLAAATYTVQRGDTLASIARQFNTTYPLLAQANNIVNPNLIYVGQQLIIPDGNPEPVPTLGLVAPTTVSSQPTTVVPQPTSNSGGSGYTTHIVQRGDTVARIARAYGVSISAIIQANALVNPNIIYPGQVLRIPSGANVVVTTQPTSPPPAATATPQPTAVGQQPTATAEPIATNEPTTIAPTATATTPLPTATTPPLPTATTPPTVGGANLLSNGSFEGGHYNLNGLAELQVPTDWRLQWTEGPNDFGTNDFRPETRVLSEIYLPPHERPMFIFDGSYTFKVFKGYGPINVSLLHDILLQPGTYELEVSIFPDQVVAYEGGGKIYATGDASQVRLFANNGQTTGWLFPTIGQKNTITYQFTVDSTQTVTVGVGMLGKYGLINNGFFVDNLRLRVVQ
ncbi:MAG: LysM peptidoglycan-binding domain-containing protein [Candidatus Promineifilaceae bacterium]